MKTDDELRSMWRAAGGEFYGPHIETGTMPEAKLLPFLRSLLLAAAPTPPAPEVDDVRYAELERQHFGDADKGTGIYAADLAAFQDRVQPWMMACFGKEISSDTVERNHRFLEEALELVQSCGCTQDEAHQLVDYVYGRPVGVIPQEVGGVMVTLAALCLAHGLDMHDAGEVELARIWTKVEQIRAKQAVKPKHSPLPVASPAPEVEPVGFITDYGMRLIKERESIGATALILHKPAGAHDIALYTHPASDGPRKTIKSITDLLRNREWAEHVSSDPDVTELEAQITAMHDDGLRKAAEGVVSAWDRGFLYEVGRTAIDNLRAELDKGKS